MVEPGPEFSDQFRADLQRLFRWRRDVRHFRAEPVPSDLVDGLLASAELAPSVGNSQPWRIIRVEEGAIRTAIRENFATANAIALAAQPDDRAGLYARLKLEGMDRAPVQLAVLVAEDPLQGHGLGRMTMPETLAYSAVLAIHTLWLAATAAGLGLGWVSILDPERAWRDLGGEPGYRLVAYLCLGWPEEPSDVPELERLGWQARRPPG